MTVVQEASVATGSGELEDQLEQQRKALTGYCYRMLGSPFEAEDAVQETMLRAWRGFERFEGRAALRSWLYRIATNVCLDTLKGRERRALPMDFGPAREPIEANLNARPEVTWIHPIPNSMLVAEADPADVAVAHETIRLAFVAALQHLPPRPLQRARATLEASGLSSDDTAAPTDEAQRELLSRYVDAFERYDLDALVSLIQADATQSMPPYDLWLSGRTDVLAWWFGPGIGCRGSRLVPTSANGSVAFGQYKPSASGSGFDPWALQVLEVKDGGIAEFTFFLDTERIFPLFGLPARLDS
jgi:RNA polymerase sigma-70 factor (ECF subfamily)